jgi:hypothetical protein
MTQIFVRPCKGIVCYVLTFFLLVACSTGSAFAQQWETVKMYDFSDPAFNFQLQGVDGFQAQFYNLNYNGASGANDPCANSISLSGYIAMQQPLEVGTNYRLSVNAKTTNSLYQLGFYYGTFPSAQSGTAIDNSIIVNGVSAVTAPGEDFASSVFTVNTDGTYWIIVKNQSGGNIFLDNFTLEREVPSAPLPTFTLTMAGENDPVSEVSIVPGGSAEICLTPDSAPATDVTLNVQVNGNTNPHFDGFSASLTFPEGSTAQQCVTLSPANNPDEESYDFEVVNSDGGETVAAFSVAVAPECMGVAGPDQMICEGESVELGTGCLPDPHPVDGVEYCYAWEPVDGLDDPTAVMPSAPPTETTAYTVYVTSSEGELIVEEEVTVTVNAPSDLTITPTEPTVCQGGTVWLEAVTWLSTDANTYKWSTGETTAAIEADAPGTYAVTITDIASGCTEVGSVEVAPATFTASITASSTTVCPGVPSVLSVNVTPEGNMEDYAFYWSNGLEGSEISEDRSGLYDVTVTNQATGCETVAEVELQEMDAAVSILPEAPVICPGGTLKLSVGDQYTNYTWSTGATEKSITVSESEVAVNPEFSVTVTAANGCEATASVEVGDAMDTDDIQAYFQGKGFFAMDIEIDPDVTLTSSEPILQRSLDLCSATICSPSEGVCVRDDAQKVIAVEGEVIENLAGLVESYMDYFKSMYGYNKIRTFITKNDDLCSCAEYLDLIEGKFEGDAPLTFWIHLFEAEGDGQDKFYILTNVPSSDAHYPGGASEGHANLSSALAQANVDGWTGNTASEAAQAVFVPMDNSLDNFMDQGLSAAQGGGSLDQILCDGASTEGMVAISPAGIPMNVPDGFTTRFVPNDDMIGLDIPEGALLGLTDFTDYEQYGKVTYYRGRASIDEQNVINDAIFVGYHRLNTLVSTSDDPNHAFFSVNPFEEDVPLFVTLGELTPPWPASTEAVDYTYSTFIGQEPEYINGINNGSGDVIKDFFSDPAILTISLVGGPATPTVPVNSSPVTVVEVLTSIELTPPLLNQERGLLFEITRADGTTVFVVIVHVNGVLKYFVWNCYTGIYEEIDLNISGDVLQEVLTDVEVLLDPAAGLTTQEEELDKPNCFVLNENIALPPSAVTPPSANPDPNLRLQDFAGVDAETEATFQQLIEQASGVFGTDIMVILTAGNGYCLEGGCNYDYTTANYRYLNESLSRLDSGEPDAIFRVHFTDDKRANFCIRLAEDFFAESGGGIQLEEDQAKSLKNTYIRAIYDVIRGAEVPSTLTNNVDEFSTGETALSRPGYYGLRPNLPPGTRVNAYTISGEVVSVLSDFMNNDFVISEKLWRADLPADNQPMFEVPEPLIAVPNVVIQENVIVGAIQMASFATTFVKDEQVRKNLWEMAQKPQELARAFYQDKKDAYSGAQGIERRNYVASEDGASIVMLFVGGGSVAKVLDFIKSIPKKAQPATRKLTDQYDGLKPHNEVNILDVASDDFYKYFQKGNFTDVEIEQYFEFVGKFDNPIDQKKLKSNPSLAVLWKKNKDGDPDFCTLNLTSGTTPVEIRSSGCFDKVDLESMIKKLPDPETPKGKAFMDKFNQLFFDEHFDADGILDLVPTDRADKFLKDLQKEGDDFLQKFVDDPDLMEAWEVAASDPNLRVVIGNLENISNHLSRNVHTADELKVAFDAATDKAKWIDDVGLGIVRKPNRNAEFVNPSGNMLKWQEEANVPAKAADILGNPNAPASARLEADIAQYIHQNKPPVTGLSIKVKRANNSSAGDLDVYTDTHLLEVKTGSGSVNYSQFDKYVDPNHPEYMNPYGKNVVLYIENPMTPSVKATVESNLPSEVSVVNSRSDLLLLLE